MVVINKIILIVSLLLFIFPKVCSAQISLMPGSHTHIMNNDSKSRGKTAKIAAGALARGVMAGTMAFKSKEVVKNERELLLKKYQDNTYDKQNASINRTSMATTAALSLGSFVATGALRDGHYMTQNKRDYMNQISIDKALLMAFQILDKEKITAANRQHIYRLRNQVAKEYSENDMEVLKVLLLPAFSYAVRDLPDLPLLIKALEVVK